MSKHGRGDSRDKVRAILFAMMARDPQTGHPLSTDEALDAIEAVYQKPAGPTELLFADIEEFRCLADITDVRCPWTEQLGHQCQLDTGHIDQHECGCEYRWSDVWVPPEPNPFGNPLIIEIRSEET